MRMRIQTLFVFCAAFCGLVANASAATIDFTVTKLPAAGQFRYNYTVSGVDFLANQALDIQFAASLYSGLMNGVAGTGFQVLLLQPNNPPGVAGDYIALATLDHPSLAGPFSVDFTFLGTGTPGAQPFTIDQYSPSGMFVSTITSGTTTPRGGVGVPEPGGFALSFLGLIVGGGWWLARRQLKGHPLKSVAPIR